ncbi:hypothetical protein SODALDRAFT_333015 [Sodiomyces alkalinus F11]|uniref:T6SS Phospholipase effector Tle1-like catalytic domain-containing protein n=1 Tax=Sodiomyces alkalinus (strain CBS 110278 / VKM F-3762 / F11) TaxID=1314773 RepID=A0A3N2PVC5_SODAK|nr:hypothetical protein SODALDRAFT_333015 [Sodiomyces alkalinus F11]ROT38440.1 hypothetical protein SODALDRAFT_333015 [Sodiomyces alkalinus F11]
MAFSFRQPVMVVHDNASSAISPTNRDRPEVEDGRGGHEPWHRPKKLVLCFDGTGNKFHGDDRDSNILKIFRMLDSSSDDQYQYYQPGIGTYVVSESLSHTGVKAKVTSWYQMAKDSAIGSSFDQHVVGGYRFLMKYCSPGDEIYMFGFSRGAYVARFLAEMLDHVGLLAHGNEEMVIFAWNAFSQWQCRRSNSTPKGKKEREKMWTFLKGFRETFSRPTKRVRFLGLFDTVNSVPRFETAWMQRSKFPFTARSSAKVVRHAVSIDERRAKFRQDLMYQQPGRNRRRHHAMQGLIDLSPLNEAIQGLHERYRPHWRMGGPTAEASARADGRGRDTVRPEQDGEDRPAPYRRHSRSRSRATSRRAGNEPVDHVSMHSRMPLSELGYDSDEEDQDIDEVWFAGGHGDIGGGWDVEAGKKNASHIPLVWMVREAMRAGLRFDIDQLEEIGCIARSEMDVDGDADVDADLRVREGPGRSVPEIHVDAPSPGSSPGGEANQKSTEDEKGNGDIDKDNDNDNDNREYGDGDDEKQETQGYGQKAKEAFEEMLFRTHLADIHDSLGYGKGLPHVSVFVWRLMEWMPFRRLDLQADGTWKPIRWPLPRGEVRDIPDDVRVHGSVIRRMQHDPKYRPGNLIIGGGGRGVRVAPPEYGMGEWICVRGHGHPIEEVWVRKPKAKTDESSSGK